MTAKPCTFEKDAHPAVVGDPGPEEVEALSEILRVLLRLSPDSRQRTLYAATSFFRLPGQR